MAAPRDLGPRAQSRRPPGKLVLRFAVLTALGLAAAAAAILVVDRRADTVRAERDAIAHARLVALAVLQHELRPADVRAALSPARRRQIDRVFRERVLLGDVLDGSVYRPGGRLVFSTAGSRARPAGSMPDIREALDGVIVSRTARSADGTRVLRTYVPVALGGKPTLAVVALDQDYAAIEAAGRESSWLVAVVLEALLVLLFLVFVPMLARVSTRIRRQIEELEHVATHDELMDIPNRLGFRRSVEDLLQDERGRGAVLLIDLDAFHEINDTIGSERGDAVLKLVARRLSDALADAGTVARLGDDEFGLLLSGAGPAAVHTVAEQARAALSTPFEADGVRVAVDASIGAALVPEHGTDFDTVLRRAGVALSVAKEDGQTSPQIYSADHDLSDVSRLTIAAELHDALAARQLEVFYQPQADFSTRVIRGVEALVRWHHPERGLLSAAAFISQAERSGLARELSRFVLEEAARQWSAWNALGLKLDVAVNLSPTDVLDQALPDEVADLLERHALDPRYLVLEITERMTIGDDRRTRDVLARLNALGARISIDDFGTGNSSLACLRRLSFQQLKLDRGFLERVPGHPADETIVRSTVEIAHAFGATVVAEGIETAAQWKRTAALGCDIAQGYLISKPLSADELTPRLLASVGRAHGAAAA